MKKVIKQNEFITMLAERAHFTKSDTLEIYRAMVEIFEESARYGIEIKLKGFGRLHFKPIKARRISSYTDKDGNFYESKDLPPASRTLFSLAENIRYADRKGDE